MYSVVIFNKIINNNQKGFGPGVRDPYQMGRGGRGNRSRGRGRGRGAPPGVPPGARFDPFGPPGAGNFDPDFDDAPPPNFNNMFL